METKEKSNIKRKFIIFGSTIAIIGTLAGTIIGVQIGRKKDEDKAHKYIQEMRFQREYLNTLYEDLEASNDNFNYLLSCIELSEKLNKLNLDQYNIESMPETAYKSIDFDVDDIMIILNNFNKNNPDEKTVAFLKTAEAEVNKTIYEGYHDVYKTLMFEAEKLISERYDLLLGEFTLDNISFENADGTWSATVNIDSGESFHITSSKAPELIYAGNSNYIMKKSGPVSEEQQKKYNKDRNELIKDGIDSAKDGIKDIYKSYKKYR